MISGSHMQTTLNAYQLYQEAEMKEREVGTHGGRRPGAGRPTGALNRLTRPVKKSAAAQGAASIERLVQLRDNAESEQVQFAASRELLDRAYGRARQEIDVTADRSIRVIINRDGNPPVFDALPAIEDRERDEDVNGF